MEINKIQLILEEIGFTRAESLVYFALLKLGEAKAGEIMKLSEVSSSKIHEHLDKLVKKGVISYILKNNVKHFYPTKAENLKILIKAQREELDKKEKELNLIIPNLHDLSKKEVITQGAEIFIGFNGLKNAFDKLYTPKVNSENSLFFSKMTKEDVEIVNKFYTQFELDDRFKDITHRGIASNIYKKYMSKRKVTKTKIKYTEAPIPSNINIYNDKTLLISWSDEPIAFLITSKEITQSFKELFEDMWKELK